MSALLKAELLKLRTTRTFVALVGAALLLSLALTILLASLVDVETESDVSDILLTDTSSLFILVLAAVGMTGEWRHRTITGTVLAAPDRLRVLLAKVAVYALAGILLSLVVSLIAMAVGSAILSSRGEITLDAGDLWSILWRNLFVAAYYGAIGVVVGALVRNQAAAIVGILVWLFLIEPAVLAAADEVGRFGPLIGAPGGFVTFEEDPDLLSRFPALLVMLAWLGGLGAAAGALLRRRDLT